MGEMRGESRRRALKRVRRVQQKWESGAMEEVRGERRRRALERVRMVQ
jgi:hypothetical protein